MMKRTLSMLLILVLCASLMAGCGSKPTTESGTPAPANDTAAAPAVPAADSADDADDADEALAPEDVEGELVIYTSMYPFAIEMMDQVLKEKFPNLTPGNDGSFFFYSGTSALITKIYGEMGDQHDQPLDADMFMVALFWKRCNKYGAIAGMISGAIMIFVWKFGVRPLGGIWNIYELLPAFVVGCIMIVVVSLLTKEPEAEIVKEFESI